VLNHNEQIFDVAHQRLAFHFYRETYMLMQINKRDLIIILSYFTIKFFTIQIKTANYGYGFAFMIKNKI